MSKANNKKNRINKKSTNNFRIESLEPRFMMDASVDYETFTNAEHFQTEITEQLQNFETADLSNLGLNGAQVEASALFNGIATDAVQKFNTLQNQIASQLNDPDAGLSGIVRQDGEIVSVDKATLLSVLANMDISGLDISVDGDLVDVSYAYAGSSNLPQMSLDTLDMAVAANDSLSIGATVNIQYNLLDNGTAVTNPGASVTVRDLFAHVGNVGGTARFMNLNVLEIADSGNSPMDVHLGFDENNPSVDLDLEFQLAANNGFPFEFNNTTDSIKVGLDDNDEIYVELPELKLANGFDDFSMTHIIEGIDFSQVPFISNPKFKVDGVEKSIPEIVAALQNYWAKCSFAVSGAVQQVQGGNGYQIDFSRVQNLFSLIQGSSTGGVLKSLTIGDKTENRTCVLGNSKQEATSLFLTFVPNIDIINESLDFGLLNLSGLTVESSISVELKVFVDASGNLCFDDFSLDEFKLDVKKTNISGTVNLGLFIRNLHTEGGQWPMNMPVIAAIQVVAGSGRADAAVGGDHDRDLVFGDSAALTFDMDVPYAAGEDLADFANINRVNGASSVALDDGLYALGADDAIYTGMDRDVVVAGEGEDLVTLGSGDDVALGDNASLVLEHNNPVGVFRPDVETVLESNNYQADNAAYLGSPTVDAGDIQDKFEDGDVPGVTLEASANGSTDTFTDATDKDWTVQQEVTPGTISRTIDIPAAGKPVAFREGETVLLTITPSSPWYQHRLQIGTEGGGTIPPLTLEWVVDGVTVTESVSNPYWNEKELPANPNAGTYYEIRVTALAAGNAKFTFI